MRLIFGLCLALFHASHVANAQSEADFFFDRIENLETVQAVAFDPAANTLFVTLSDKTFHFDLFPLRLRSEVEHKFHATSNGLDPRGNLIVVGEEEREDSKKRLFSLGSLSLYRNVRQDGLANKPLTIELDVAPLSGVTFDSSGVAYIQSATHHAVLRYDVLGHEKGTFKFDDISLNCGPTAKFSVLKYGDALNFISTVQTKDQLELGTIDGEGQGVCIDGDRLFVAKTKAPLDKKSGFSVKDHSLIQPSAIGVEQSGGNGLMMFDTTTNQLTFLPIVEYGGEISLRRSAQEVFDLSGVMGDTSGRLIRLATDATGEAIMVAGFDEKEVHRLTWNGSEFEYLGQFNMKASVKNIFVSDNGGYAAIVTGAPNGASRDKPQNEITLVRQPSSIPKDTPIGVARYSVASLQQAFRNAGDKEVEVDGILGPQTLQAIEKYRNETEPARSAAASSLEKDDLIRGILPNWPAQTGDN